MTDDDDDRPTPPDRPGSKRARSHWGDAQRADVGKARRKTPPAGVPRPTTSVEGGITPIQHILDVIANATMTPEERMNAALRELWQHIANVEMRAREARGDEGDLTKVRHELAELRLDVVARFADLHGVSGDNGKLGKLADAIEHVAGRMRTLLNRLWWGFTVMVAALGGAAVKLVMIGKVAGQIEAQVANDTARIQLLEQVVLLQQRAFTPGKVQTP